MNQHTAKAGTATRRLLGTIMVLTVMLLLVLSAFAEKESSKHTVGIGVDAQEDGIDVTSVVPGGPAETAGVQAGDLLFAVNDIEIHTLDEYDRALAASGGPLSTFHVRRHGAPVVLEVEPGTPFPVAAFLRTTMVSLAYLGLALLALRHRRRDWRAGLLALLCMGIAIEIALPSSFFGIGSVEQLTFVLFFLLTGLQCGVEVHLVSNIPRRAPWASSGHWVIPTFYCLAMGLGVLLALEPLGIAITGMSWSPISSQVSGNLFTGWLVTWALLVVSILVYQITHQSDMRQRNQALLVLIGVAPWAAYAIFLMVADLLGIPYPSWTYLAEDLMLFALPLAMLIAIVRYDLLDMERLVRRSLVYGVLSTYLVIGLVLLGFWAVPRIAGDSGGLVLWLVAAGCVLLGMSVHWLRSGTEMMIERRVFPERHALRQRLIRLAAEVPERGEAPAMAAHLADRLAQIMETGWAAVIISGSHTGIPPSQSMSREEKGKARQLASILRRDGVAARTLARVRRPVTVRRLKRELPGIGEQLSELGVELLVPLFFRNELIGTVCLSSKRGGELFAGEETELLNLFSHQVAAAFENLKLHQHATYEGLTGLLRREAILDTLNKECERAIRGRRPLVVAMADLDRFKQVNDRHGHLFGDHVLQTVSNIIRQRVRTIDAVGRYGGEEFLIVFPDTDVSGAKVVAEDLRGAVERHVFQPDSDAPMNVSISIGLAGVDVAVGDPERLAISLIESADEMLYVAKAGGRNQVLAKG